MITSCPEWHHVNVIYKSNNLLYKHLRQQFGRLISLQKLSTRPTLIPIEKAELKENFEDLFKVKTEDAKINVILFSHSNDLETFSLEKIKQILIRCCMEEITVFIHSFESNKSKEEIKDFLNNPDY